VLQFGFRNPISGDIEGFDVDVLHAVANAIFGDPNAIEYKVINYAQRIPSLLDNSVDIVAHTMTINCARWQQIAFSSEYYAAGQTVLVGIDSTATGIESFEGNGQKVCVAKGSTNLEELVNTYPTVERVEVDDLTDCLVLFQQSAVDAITGDNTVMAGFEAQDPFAHQVGEKFTQEPYGLGISQDHPEFVEFVNLVLEQMREDGSLLALQEKWINDSNPPPVAVYGREPVG
jgi:polar amino acid transport system substrate-binding protein